MEITVRYADRAELPRVNELRKMVNELHANGRPDIFRPGFCAELQQHVYQIPYTTLFRSRKSVV